MTNKYKLCRVWYDQHSVVKPINEEGLEYGNPLMAFEEEENYYYAIFENSGDNENEDWDEWGYYDQDFDKALEEYKKLVKGGEK